MWLTRRRALVAVLFLALSACSGGGTEPLPTMTGSWIGTSGTLSMTFTLSQAAATVSGTGNMTGNGVAVALTASGTFSHPGLSMNLTAVGFEPMNYTGTLSGNTITGTLNGSGFVNRAFALTRQNVLAR